VKNPSSSRYNIAVLMNKVDDHYHSIVYKSIKKTVQNSDFNLIILAGRPLDSTYQFDRFHNMIFRYAQIDFFDGIIIFAGSIFNFVTKEKYLDFLNQYKHQKYISMDFEVENHPYILIDNFNAMRKETEHFIVEHGKKRIAFITGKPSSQIAVDRLNGYLQALSDHKIPYDETLVVEGDFVSISGQKAVIELIDKRCAKFDAIIASNDEMIMGAINELKKRKIKIPEDCAIAGCDNFEHVKFHNPPITSIHIPLDEQIECAFALLQDYIETDTISHEIMNTKLIARKTCGCQYSPIIMKNGRNKEKNLSTNQDLIELIRSFNDIHPGVEKIFLNNIEQLHEALVNDIGSCNDTLSSFETLFIQIMQNFFKDSQELFSVQKILSVFELMAFYKDKEKKMESVIGETFRKLQVYCGNFFKCNTMGNNQDIIRFILNSVSIYSDIVPNEDIDQLVFSIFRTCVSVNINTGHIAIFDHETGKDRTRLLLSFKDREIIKTDTHKVYSADNLLEYVESHRGNRIIMALPLTCQNENYGVAFFEENDLNPAIFENLRSQISSALKGSNQFYEQALIEKELYRTVDTLEKRRNELQTRLEELNLAQRNVIEKEKNAALGNMVAGISHEINTPLGICITSASHLLERSRNLLRIYKEGSLKKNDFEAHLSTVKETTRIIMDNLNRAVQIISSFKQLAVDQSSNRQRKFNIKECIDDVLITLNPIFKKKAISISVNCPDTIRANNYPGALSKALSELINNSLDHGLSDKNEADPGEIIITVTKKNDNAVIDYSDNGKGIPEEVLKNFFQPFVTTRRTENRLGLGLTIIHSAITRDMNGNVTYTPRQNSGTNFSLSFPLNLSKRNELTS